MKEAETERKDGFSEAREKIEGIIEVLSSGEMKGVGHSGLEEYIEEEGREVLRRLLQGYLDSREYEEAEEECLGVDQKKELTVGIKRED